MSARISGVKNFVSIGDSFVRALPVSQVKSANANGSATGGFAAPDLPFSVAFRATAARTFSVGMTLLPGAAAVTVAPLDGSMAVEEAGFVAEASAAGAA